MDTPTPHDPPVCAHAPYRLPPLQAPEAPAVPRRSRVVALLSALSLALSFASFLVVHHTATSLASLTTPHAFRARRPPVSLYDAAEDFARRHGLPLYVAPDVRARALELRATDCLDGSALDALRALDAYAATRNLRAHLVDGVLRLEARVVPSVFGCDDTLARCAERLDAQALLHIVYDPSVGERRVRIYFRHAAATMPTTLAALNAAGLDVDVDGRTLRAFAQGPTPEPARASLREDAVLRLSSGDFVLSRASLAAAIESAPPVLRNTRILPETRDGRIVGVRLLRVGDDELAGWLGLRSGDVLRRVNGYELASPERCLEAYSRLRETRVVTLELERNGHLVRLRYRIV